MHQSFLLYRQMLHLKIALLLSALVLLLYLVEDTGLGVPHNGGTQLGYATGILGSLLILWLMWLGVRKRCYCSYIGSVQSWVSAHIYLGLATVMIVTLHTGFQFGVNVHTLAYVLMMLVVFSGLYGVSAYLRLPQKMADNQGGMTQDLILHEIIDLEQEVLELGEGLNEQIHTALLHSIERTVLGGNVWQQLTAANPRLQRKISKQQRQALKKSCSGSGDESHDYAMFVIAEHLLHTENKEQAGQMRRLLELLERKNALVGRLRRSVRYQAWMDIWRYVHVPLSFAMLAALIIHIVTVFLYW
ncbi:hypothetical protein QUF61_07330 [Candidatus Venteria ishoeyi]|uniref:hypothetical protein n=1 Tax=Candidatus Venteria ishoeyi TaxID=1899563 RepID=UPI0025A667D5|nr:hypothetical protein [Candidatus Venteria ishoeyi]MDM8546290.1 hypothetical protein [Candidatus Venteria ishoeyi]